MSLSRNAYPQKLLSPPKSYQDQLLHNGLTYDVEGVSAAPSRRRWRTSGGKREFSSNVFFATLSPNVSFGPGSPLFALLNVFKSSDFSMIAPVRLETRTCKKNFNMESIRRNKMWKTKTI
jgi:hypothetical protein